MGGGLAAATLVSAPATATVAAPPPALVVMVDAVTDNYKTWDRAADESRTSMLMRAVSVGTTTYVVNDAGTPNGAPTAMAQGIPLKVAGGSGTSAYLRFTGITLYRIFDVGAFGPFFQVNKVTLQTSPPSFTATVHRASDDAVLGRTLVDYRYDAAVAGLGADSVEHNGPGGRWFVYDGAHHEASGADNRNKTPLNWPDAVAVRSSQVAVGAGGKVLVSPVDVTGIPVPGFRTWPSAGPPQPMPITLGWNPSTGQPTQTTGDAAIRVVPVTLSAGSYALSASSTCQGFCKQDYVANTISGSGTVTATAAAPTKPRIVVDTPDPTEGSNGKWNPFTVTLSRSGDVTGTTAATISLTGADPNDISFRTTKVTFRPGETYRELTGYVYGDTVDESDESWGLAVTAPGADVVTTVVTVVDDDSSGVDHDTDSALRQLPDGAWKGAGVVDRSLADVGTDQTLAFAVPRGQVGRVQVSVKNTGTAAEPFALASSITGEGPRVTFLVDGTDVTAAVNSGTYATTSISPGTKKYVTIRFVVPAGATVGAARKVYLHAIPSGGTSADKDVVLAKVTVS